jgi:glutamate 5-kinase
VLIREVLAADETLDRFAGDSASEAGTGGMRTKVVAARLAGSAGTQTVVANGSLSDVLVRVVSGDGLGTRFLPSTTRLESRKRWILAEQRLGTVWIDTGAASRLRSGGASLLPVGVVAVDGDFERAAVVAVRCGEDLVGVGICAYGSSEIQRIAGARSDQIAVRLGFESGAEVIHRDDFVLT